ncbi:DUF4352 domain-containing protein [Shouchella shacheensis]|uniref:DUF4352 domain-containing protein n=1 Tax=Shouchella shacheensis TaxID=1649580 RepID=UPI00073FFFD6|nr:DUF4352 domain-containing protein [Shouchella shacheensis]
MKTYVGLMGMAATLVLLGACEESAVEQVDQEAGAEETEAQASEESTNDEEATEDEVVEDTISTGDTMNFDGLEITLNDAYTSEGSEWETPENGHYVILDLTIANTTEESANISTLMQMSLQDGEGYTHDVALYTEAKGSLDGEIGSGRDMRGEVAFDVDDSEAYEFIFENPFTSGQAIWTIEEL